MGSGISDAAKSYYQGAADAAVGNSVDRVVNAYLRTHKEELDRDRAADPDHPERWNVVLDAYQSATGRRELPTYANRSFLSSITYSLGTVAGSNGGVPVDYGLGTRQFIYKYTGGLVDVGGKDDPPPPPPPAWLENAIFWAKIAAALLIVINLLPPVLRVVRGYKESTKRFPPSM